MCLRVTSENCCPSGGDDVQSVDQANNLRQTAILETLRNEI